MPSITFPRDAFRQNVMDYSRELWSSGVDACFWRELLQNARDAGARRTNIAIQVQDKVTTVVFEDNGRGMDRDTLVNGMLTNAGSIKPTGAAGGFGMAKCLLVFAPNSVKIETNDLAVKVEGINYEWLPVNSPIAGTRFTIVIDNAGYSPEKQITPTLEGLKFLLTRSDMGDMSIWCGVERLNISRLTSDTEPVREWKEFGAMAYHVPKGIPIKNRSEEPVMVVQHRGIWVMDMVISEEVKGSVFVNIQEEPRKVLNAARVSIASYDLRSKLDGFLRDLSRSPKQTLKTQKWVKRYDGGMMTVTSAANLARAMMEKPTGGTSLAVVDRREWLRLLADKLATSGTRLPAELLEPSRLNLTGEENLHEKAALLAWSPAMMVVNEREQPVHPQWLPETMGKKAKRILTIWSEMIKQFLILSKAYGCTFGVGFIFCEDEEQTLAQWRKEEDGTVWFLINPLDKEGQMRFNLSDQSDRSEMISEAAHEVCHEICRVSYHGDEFANRLTDLMTLTLNHSDIFNSIWKIRPKD